jgi:hypothetical protein
MVEGVNSTYTVRTFVNAKNKANKGTNEIRLERFSWDLWVPR